MHAHIIMNITRFSNILIPLIYTPFILFLTNIYSLFNNGEPVLRLDSHVCCGF